MATKRLHFETLQLHVGQEQPDVATDARAVPIYKPLLMYFTTQLMQQHDSAYRIRGISMDV